MDPDGAKGLKFELVLPSSRFLFLPPHPDLLTQDLSLNLDGKREAEGSTQDAPRTTGQGTLLSPGSEEDVQ